MRVCDRHNEERAASGIVIEETDERVDLCDRCLQEIRAFVGSEEQKLEPKRKKTLLERVKDSVKTE